MYRLPISGFPMIEPEEADPEVAHLYAEIQRETEHPFVPNPDKALASSPGVLAIHLDMLTTMNRNLSLPQSLIAMILYCIANARNCTYCATNNELYCRTLGVDEETLNNLAYNLDNISPERLQTIIQFAMQCAFSPQSLEASDYDRVRQQGISDDELIQIIFLAALANFNDTMSDSMKIEVEPAVLEALGR